MTYLGLDIGSKRIGGAVSDPSGMLATPVGIVPGDESLDQMSERLREIVRQRSVDALVVGLPRHMNGDLGPEAERVQMLADEFAARLGVPVEMWDERLTTVEATRRMVEAGVRRSKRKQVVDQLAATLILQGFLDSRSPLGAAP